MLVIRPIGPQDQDALYQIAVDSGVGFTSLPINRDVLKEKIARSVASFAKPLDAPDDEGYLFVLEDTETGEVMGTTAIEASVGTRAPFYHYHRQTVVHASPTLEVHNKMEVLTLCNHYTGCAEVCTLFLQESHRNGTNGRLLSKSRFLFMAQFAERFGSKVIAEMRGVNDASGNSPFWHWLGTHFFSMEFKQADYLVGLGNKVFIAELMPKYPLYVNLLSPEAQAVISHVHEKTKPALRLLEKEGFQHIGYVDIFDAGPTVESQLKDVSSVKNSAIFKVKIAPPKDDAELFLISNTELENFRSSIVPVSFDDQGKAIISDETATGLHLTEQSLCRLVAVEAYYKTLQRL
ncbi:MAG TPA: arginine N-succinyltransferase [Oceanospirillaceae bacterium]|nr:arginine N-succinyltransferase [Oceanospirillaceae bacterium]